jgi:hypothetical protein
MATAASKLAPSQGHSWWDDELCSLLAAAPALSPAARAAVSSVLQSLAGDAATDPETCSDVQMLLAVVDAPRRQDAPPARQLQTRLEPRLAA